MIAALEKIIRVSLLGSLFLLSLNVCAQSVDLLTGRLQMSIPLGAIQANGIDIPVSINYQGGATRVPQGDGSCGLGWGLSASGAVSRLVRGLPDELNHIAKKGWLCSPAKQTIQNFVPSADDDLSNCPDVNEGNDWNAIDAMLGAYVNDLEPDLFYISAPGLSAQFIFGTDNLPQLLSYQDIKIEFINGDFVVRNNQGMVYTFSTKETTSRSAGILGYGINTQCNYFTDADPISFTARWNLTSMAFVPTGTTATFAYTNLPEAFGRDYYNADSTNWVEDRIQPLRINTISLKSYTASFSWQNDLLTKVVFTESTTQDRAEAQLVFSNQTYLRNAKSVLSKVLIGGNAPQMAYEFSYNPFPTIAWRNNFGMDFFGFYNGDNTNNNKPNLYFYPNESDGRRLRVAPITPIPPSGGPTILSGKDRSVNSDFTYYGSLSRITLPTGGFSDIEYEPNRYKDASVNQEMLGGNVRVRKITSYGGEIAFGKTIDDVSGYRSIVKQYEYKLTDNTSSGVLLDPITLGYATTQAVIQTVQQIGEDPTIMYTRVTEKVTGQGSRTHEYSIPGVFPETVNGNWKATKNRIARKVGSSCVMASNVKNGYYVFPYAPSTNYDYKRGFLTRVIENSETSIPVGEKIFTPIELTKNPLVIKAIRLERLGDIFYYGVYEIITGRVQAVDTEISKIASEVTPSLWLQTTSQNIFNSNNMLQGITTTMPDNSTVLTKNKYAKDFQFVNPAGTDTMAVALKYLNENFRHGELVEQIKRVTLAGVATPSVSASLTIYRNFGGSRVLPYYKKVIPPGAAFTEAAVSSDAFVPDGDYVTVQTFKDFDSENRLLLEFGNKRDTLSHHYALEPSFEVATFGNARPQQCIYEGFEQTTSFGLSTLGNGFATDAGWTGSKSIKFSNNTDKLVSSSSSLIQKQKGSNSYWVSCWVMAASGKVITVTCKQGATVVSVNLTTTQNNVWEYLEGTLILSAITGPFVMEVVTNASVAQPVWLDDVVLRPSEALVSHKTVRPFTGVTSETDNRGNSVKYEYDNGKRLVKKYDRRRNLVLKNDYYQKKSTPKCVLSSFFSRPIGRLMANTMITFNAGQTCGNAISYVWEVDGTVVSGASGSSMSYTFTSIGSHSIKLTISDPTYGSSSFTDTVCLEALIELIFTNALGNLVDPLTVFNCNSPLPITATISMSGLPFTQVEWIAGWVSSDGLFFQDGNPMITNYSSLILTPNKIYKARPVLSPSSFAGGGCPGISSITSVSTGKFGILQDNSGNCQ